MSLWQLVSEPRQPKTKGAKYIGNLETFGDISISVPSTYPITLEGTVPRCPPKSPPLHIPVISNSFLCIFKSATLDS